VTPEDHDPVDDVDEALSPEDEETVRRLLVAAGGPVQTPDDVAARLDDVLADLHAERGGSATAPVTDLAARRRRNWPKVLVAAAAVAVVGVGIGNIPGNLGSGGDDAASSGQAGGVAEDSLAGAGDGGAPPAEDPATTSERNTLQPNTLLGTAPTSTLPRVRAGSATLDAQRILALSLDSAVIDEPVAPNRARTRTCDIPAISRGETLVAVRFDGRRASLLFGKPDTTGNREAQVYPCDDSESPVLVTSVEAR
jgi:hypothetical protein